MVGVFQTVPPCSSSILGCRLCVGVKRLNRMLLVVFMAALVLAPSAQLISALPELTVEIEQNYYISGDIVAITGIASADATLEITIKHAYVQVFTAKVVADSSGGYRALYTLPSTALNGLYTITATSGSLTSDTVFVVTTDSISEIARRQIETAEQSRAMSERTIHEITGLGNLVPAEAASDLASGVKATLEAKALYTKGEYAASAEAAQLAMNKFRIAMTLAIRNAKNGYEYTASPSEVLSRKVEMLSDEVEKLSAVIANLGESGEDVAAIDALIESARTSLGSAVTKINNGDVSEAAGALAAAQIGLQDAKQILKPLVVGLREGLMEQFKNHLKARLSASIGDLDKLRDQVQVVNMNAAAQRLGYANGLITRAEMRLSEGMFDEALSDLEAASKEFGLGLRDVDKGSLSQGLMQVNVIRCQIQVQQGISERLRRQGQDVSALDSHILELEKLVEDGMGMMIRGDASGANGLFDNTQQGGQYYGGGPGNGDAKGGGGR